jgi:nicotinamidase-related amidase
MIPTPLPPVGRVLTGPVLLDLNTQRDLFAADGAYPLFQFEKLLDPIKKLFSFAGRARLPIISTRLQNAVNPRYERDRSVSKYICMNGAPGQEKIPASLVRRRQEMPADCGTSLPVEGFHYAQQWIFDIPEFNLFECPRLDRLLSENEAATYFIVGGALEHTVRTAVLGLLQRRAKVAVVSDCLGMWDQYEGDMALRQIESKNIEWFTSAELIAKLSAKPPRPAPPVVPHARPHFSPKPAPRTPVPAAKGRDAKGGPSKRSFRI